MNLVHVPRQSLSGLQATVHAASPFSGLYGMMSAMQDKTQIDICRECA